MLKVLDLGLGTLVSSVKLVSVKKKFKTARIERTIDRVSYSQKFVQLVSTHFEKMLSVKQKFDQKTINLSRETIPTNDKNFTTKKFAPEKSTKKRFFLVFPEHKNNKNMPRKKLRKVHCSSILRGKQNNKQKIVGDSRINKKKLQKCPANDPLPFLSYLVYNVEFFFWSL